MRTSSEHAAEMMLKEYTDDSIDPVVMSGRWNVASIRNREIKNVVRCFMNATARFEPWIYHISKWDSVYIKFKDQSMGSVRVADHKQLNHYSYTWNIEVGSKKAFRSEYQGNVLRTYCNPSHIDMLLDELSDRFQTVSAPKVDYSSLLNVKYKDIRG